MKWDGIIKGSNKERIPAIEYWVLETFDFSLEEGAFYQILLNKKYSTKTWKYFADKLSISLKSFSRLLNELESLGIIERYRVKTIGNRCRTVIVPLVDIHGLIPKPDIIARVKMGYSDIMREEGL